MARALRAIVVSVQLICCICAIAADAVFHAEDDRDDTPKVRQWVWANWQRHTPATAILKWRTVEGDTGTTQYTVSKDASGAWYLSIHLQGTDTFADSDADARRDRWTVAYAVERVEKPYHDDWPGKPIGHSRPLPPTKYVLELRDRQKNLLFHL
jgi:hypothetical protein